MWDRCPPGHLPMLTNKSQSGQASGRATVEDLGTVHTQRVLDTANDLLRDAKRGNKRDGRPKVAEGPVDLRLEYCCPEPPSILRSAYLDGVMRHPRR
jgi:hypothetical protein